MVDLLQEACHFFRVIFSAFSHRVDAHQIKRLPLVTKFLEILFDSMEKQFKHFSLYEFRSPDDDDSGKQMNMEFVQKLDEAREIAGIPFIINSGFRTRKHNDWLMANGYPASPHSSHLKGLAADIKVKNDSHRHIILSALMEVGLNRFGIGKNYIHVDMDSGKLKNRIWVY